VSRRLREGYDYGQHCRNCVVAAKCLSPLEEMVRVYQLYKALGKVERLSTLAYYYRNMTGLSTKPLKGCVG